MAGSGRDQSYEGPPRFQDETRAEARAPGFGLFASALLAGSLGLGAFCVSCFVSIFGILIYNQGGHHAVDYADSYRYVALPVGVAALLVSGVVLLGLWLRRRMSGPVRSSE